MTRAKLIDIIKSFTTLRVDNLIEYKNTYSQADMTNNSLVPYGLISNIVGTHEVYVESASSLVIDWQNDILTGSQTYADVFGNDLPKPMHYFFDGVDTYTRGGVEPLVVRTGGLIDTVTFNWGYSTDCVIVF